MIANVVAHVEHACSVVGVDRIRIGSDFDGTSDLPMGLNEVSCFPSLV